MAPLPSHCALDILGTRAESNPNSAALSYMGDDISFQALVSDIEHRCQKLRSLGIDSNTRIGIAAANSPGLISELFAIEAAGASPVLLNLRLTEQELQIQTSSTGCSFVISGPTEVITRTEDPKQSIDAQYPPHQLHSGTILFSSGTTGAPRGILLPHQSLWNSAKASNSVTGLSAGDTWLLSLPLYHTGGLLIPYRCALAGACCRISSGLSAAHVSAELDQHPITHLSLVPTVFRELLELRRSNFPSTLKMVLLGGQPPSNELVQMALDAGVPVLLSYGMTESAAHVTAMHIREWTKRPGSSGRALPHVEISIRDDSGEILPAGKCGTVSLRGASLCTAVITSDGTILRDLDSWLITRDIGFLDEDGYLYIQGRADDLINSGGEKFFASEIEHAALQYPGVKKCAVLRISSDRWGERPVLFVQPESIANFDKNALKDFLTRRLARIKCPQLINVIQEIPVTDTGKVNYSALRALPSINNLQAADQ